MQATRSDQRLEEKFGEVGEAVRVNANLSDHLAEIFSIIFKDPQHPPISSATFSVVTMPTHISLCVRGYDLSSTHT